MTRAINTSGKKGFTLIELLVALGNISCDHWSGIHFLGTSQQRYQTESQVLTSFQEARLALDQIVRDVNDSGYPPPTFDGGNANFYASFPFAWSPGYAAGNSCAIELGSAYSAPFRGIPILSSRPIPNPQDPNCRAKLHCSVDSLSIKQHDAHAGRGPQGVRYRPRRGVYGSQRRAACAIRAKCCKHCGAARFFRNTCDTPTALQPQPQPWFFGRGRQLCRQTCEDVVITLIVAAPQPDAKTGQRRLVVLNGRGRRINPNQ